MLLALCHRQCGRARRTRASGAATSSTYASPLEILLSPDGARLYVLCQESEEVRVLDAASLRGDKNDRSGPRAARHLRSRTMATRLFVTNSWDDTLSVIDTQHVDGDRNLAGGRGASGVVEDSAGKRLFVANRISNDVAVLDARPALKKSG